MTAQKPVASTPVKEYAAAQISNLLDRVVYELHKAGQSKDEEAVHDARVSIRRFTQALRAFHQFLPKGPVKKIRKRLDGIMKLSAEVRNRDIALHLLEEAGVPEDATVRSRLMAERGAAARKLAAALKRWGGQNYSAKWRNRLGLS